MPDNPGLRPASTVMLLRQRSQMEVFMVVRHHQIDFASGALVFPGGKVDKADADANLRSLCGSIDGWTDQELAFRIAAIREAFEECGVLLARDSAGALVQKDRLSDLERYREALEADRIGMAEFAERENLTLACDLLQPFAHWITPEGMPKRFDTHFFLAGAPEDQVALHGGRESVDSAWINPKQALAEAEQGKWTIIFPTRMNLTKLARYTSVDEAMEKSKGEAIVTVQPVITGQGGDMKLRIPEEAGYGITEEPITGKLA